MNLARLLVFGSLCGATAASLPPRPPDPACSYEASPEDTGQPTVKKQVPVGTILSGQTSLDFDGDGRPELMRVIARVERDRAVNTVTGQQSDSMFCWFHTTLEIRNASRRLSYRDKWSIKFEDMPLLVATHRAASPEDYFSRFGNLQGYFRTGVDTVASTEVRIDSEAVEWSLKAQQIGGASARTISNELRKQRVVRVFTYRAEWREDLRIVAYVPSLRRGVAIQIGY